MRSCVRVSGTPQTGRILWNSGQFWDCFVSMPRVTGTVSRFDVRLQSSRLNRLRIPKTGPVPSRALNFEVAPQCHRKGDCHEYRCTHRKTPHGACPSTATWRLHTGISLGRGPVRKQSWHSSLKCPVAASNFRFGRPASCATALSKVVAMSSGAESPALSEIVPVVRVHTLARAEANGTASVTDAGRPSIPQSVGPPCPPCPPPGATEEIGALPAAHPSDCSQIAGDSAHSGRTWARLRDPARFLVAVGPRL